MTQQLYSQEDGVVAFKIPVRNSLKFNRHFINPTFSFVREQNKYISFNNKREWVQFDDAPQTYLFGYSGRFRENIGVGLTMFQQNYGVLTTFGGVLKAHTEFDSAANDNVISRTEISCNARFIIISQVNSVVHTHDASRIKPSS